MAKVAGKESLFLISDLGKVTKPHKDLVTAQFYKDRGQYKDEWKDIPPVPEEDDYMSFYFRQLSATIVGAGSWKATDFSNEAVLRDSMMKLLNKPAYKNHELRVDSEVGFVGEPRWTQSYIDAQGRRIPAGIDAPFVIDKVLHPDLVRKLSAKVSPIQAASVTVLFEWEASHEFERDYDFYYHLGETIDGQMVRRVVHGIVDYEESSLVWNGADPYARIHDKNGNLVNVDNSAIISAAKFDADPLRDLYKDNRKYFIVDCLDSEKRVSLEKTSNHKTSNFNTDTMNEFQKFVAEMLGKKYEEVTPADLEGLKLVKGAEFESFKKEAGELPTVKQSIEQLTADKQQLETEKQELSAKKEEAEKLFNENKTFIDFGKAALESKRKEAKEMYAKFSEGKTEEVILKEIEGGDIVSLEAKIKMWGGKVYQSFGAHCKKCSSTEIELRSSKEEPYGQGKPAPSVFHIADAMR